MRKTAKCSDPSPFFTMREILSANWPTVVAVLAEERKKDRDTAGSVAIGRLRFTLWAPPLRPGVRRALPDLEQVGRN